MDCPNCSSSLKEKEVINKPYSIYVGECVECGGLWFDNNKLEEYRASVLSTSQYTVLPEFEPIPAQTSSPCCYCKQDTLMFYNVGSHVIRRCSKCSGIFLSKAQILELAKKEKDISMAESMVEVGFWAVILSGMLGN